ncbi:MAG TPA: alpha/beta fold hydrolase [Xanthobacteraceae bacterium]|nr:alpha/beta fold hydrolase [Xanthobacteraceae bacterium]
MPYVTNQGVRIHYEVEGAGPPLVLQHGYTFNSELWYRFGYVDVLKPHYRLVLVDARGHGASDKPHDRAAYAWPVNIADILAVLDHLGIARAAFWGYSMGGAIVLGLAQHAPHRVSALIVGGATAYPTSLATLPDGSNPEAFIAWLETTVGARASPEFRALLLSSDLRALAAAAQDRPSMLEGLPKMRMPCLFYAGDSDGRFTNARRTAEQIPNAVFVPLRGLNHPEAFFRAADLVVPHAMKFLSAASSPD